jgi:hypothetical protein
MASASCCWSLRGLPTDAPACRRHGPRTQPGDPAKVAKAIITAVESDEPPAFPLLGNDALRTYRWLAAAGLANRDLGASHL